jgi:hypothetical protein
VSAQLVDLLRQEGFNITRLGAHGVVLNATQVQPGTQVRYAVYNNTSGAFGDYRYRVRVKAGQTVVIDAPFSAGRLNPACCSVGNITVARGAPAGAGISGSHGNLTVTLDSGLAAAGAVIEIAPEQPGGDAAFLYVEERPKPAPSQINADVLAIRKESIVGSLGQVVCRPVRAPKVIGEFVRVAYETQPLVRRDGAGEWLLVNASVSPIGGGAVATEWGWVPVGLADVSVTLVSGSLRAGYTVYLVYAYRDAVLDYCRAAGFQTAGTGFPVSQWFCESATSEPFGARLQPAGIFRPWCETAVAASHVRTWLEEALRNGPYALVRADTVRLSAETREEEFDVFAGNGWTRVSAGMKVDWVLPGPVVLELPDRAPGFVLSDLRAGRLRRVYVVRDGTPVDLRIARSDFTAFALGTQRVTGSGLRGLADRYKAYLSERERQAEGAYGECMQQARREYEGCVQRCNAPGVSQSDRERCTEHCKEVLGVMERACDLKRAVMRPTPAEYQVPGSIYAIADTIENWVLNYAVGPVPVTVYHLPGESPLQVIAGNRDLVTAAVGRLAGRAGASTAGLEVYIAEGAFNPYSLYSYIAVERKAECVVRRGAAELRPVHAAVPRITGAPGARVWRLDGTPVDPRELVRRLALAGTEWGAGGNVVIFVDAPPTATDEELCARIGGTPARPQPPPPAAPEVRQASVVYYACLHVDGRAGRVLGRGACVDSGTYVLQDSSIRRVPSPPAGSTALSAACSERRVCSWAVVSGSVPDLPSALSRVEVDVVLEADLSVYVPRAPEGKRAVYAVLVTDPFRPGMMVRLDPLDGIPIEGTGTVAVKRLRGTARAPLLHEPARVRGTLRLVASVDGAEEKHDFPVEIVPVVPEDVSGAPGVPQETVTQPVSARAQFEPDEASRTMRLRAALKFSAEGQYTVRLVARVPGSAAPVERSASISVPRDVPAGKEWETSASLALAQGEYWGAAEVYSADGRLLARDETRYSYAPGGAPVEGAQPECLWLRPGGSVRIAMRAPRAVRFAVDAAIHVGTDVSSVPAVTQMSYVPLELVETGTGRRVRVAETDSFALVLTLGRVDIPPGAFILIPLRIYHGPNLESAAYKVAAIAADSQTASAACSAALRGLAARP